jgi:hypothetical protein
MSWLRTFYQLVHSDTRWTKEQGWRVVNWTLLLYGAILGIAKFLLPTLPQITFVLVDGGVLLVAIIYLVDLHLSAAALRRSATRIEGEIPEASLLERRTHDTYHFLYLGIQLVVVVAAFVLVTAAHLLIGSGNVAA